MKNETHYIKKIGIYRFVIGPIFKINKPLKNMSVLQQENQMMKSIKMNETM